MRVVYDVYLAFKIVRVDVDVAAELADGVNADACLTVRADLDNVGTRTARDVTAVTAFAAGKGRSTRVRAILTDESLCKLERERALARAVSTLDNVGVGQIGIFGEQRPRKPRAKLFISYDLRKDLLLRLTSFQNNYT